MNHMTQHARKRCQQRGIPETVVDSLFIYGEFHHARAAEVCHFSKRSKQLIKKEGGRSLLRKIEKYLNCYLVYRDGRVVTVGRRYKHLHCHQRKGDLFMEISARVRRGPETGTKLTPHRYKTGGYAVSKTRFKCDYLFVYALQELPKYLEQGFRLRMSNSTSLNHRSPSLIAARNIFVRNTGGAV